MRYRPSIVFAFIVVVILGMMSQLPGPPRPYTIAETVALRPGRVAKVSGFVMERSVSLRNGRLSFRIRSEEDTSTLRVSYRDGWPDGFREYGQVIARGRKTRDGLEATSLMVAQGGPYASPPRDLPVPPALAEAVGRELGEGSVVTGARYRGEDEWDVVPKEPLPSSRTLYRLLRELEPTQTVPPVGSGTLVVYVSSPDGTSGEGLEWSRGTGLLLRFVAIPTGEPASSALDRQYVCSAYVDSAELARLAARP